MQRFLQEIGYEYHIWAENYFNNRYPAGNNFDDLFLHYETKELSQNIEITFKNPKVRLIISTFYKEIFPFLEKLLM